MDQHPGHTPQGLVGVEGVGGAFSSSQKVCGKMVYGDVTLLAP